MNIWGIFTTIVLLFVIFSFLNITYHYMKRYTRTRGYNIFASKRWKMDLF